MEWYLLDLQSNETHADVWADKVTARGTRLGGVQLWLAYLEIFHQLGDVKELLL